MPNDHKKAPSASITFRQYLVGCALSGAALDSKATPQEVAKRAVAIADATLRAVRAAAVQRRDQRASIADGQQRPHAGPLVRSESVWIDGAARFAAKWAIAVLSLAALSRAGRTPLDADLAAGGAGAPGSSDGGAAQCAAFRAAV